MRVGLFWSIILFLTIGSTWGEEKIERDTLSTVDSLSIGISKEALKESQGWREDSLKRKNPIVLGVGSLLIPGAGQVMSRHYVKAGFFVALDAIFFSQANFWHNQFLVERVNTRISQEEAMIAKDPSDSVYKWELSMFDKHSGIDAQFSSYNFLAWAIGAHVYNVLDAVNSSNAFKNSKARNPGTAALLSIPPGLGLGQLYNGSFSKAGMIMMTQVSLGLMAYNSQRLMKRAEEHYIRLSDPGLDSLTKTRALDLLPQWKSLQNRSFTNRNMYLWYSIFFYFYTMFDAVVDAYLHDYPDKMKIEPDLGIGLNAIQFSLHTTF